MGRILEHLFFKKIRRDPEHCATRLVTEDNKNEALHIHYRNLRLEFLSDEFVLFARHIQSAFSAFTNGTARSDDDGRDPRQHRFVLAENEISSHSKVKNTDELKIEVNKLGREHYIHVHLRDLRIDFSPEEYKDFAAGIAQSLASLQNWESKRQDRRLENLREFFEVLNRESIEYLVIRNWKGLPESAKTGTHSDLDLLFSSRKEIARFVKLTAIQSRRPHEGSTYELVFKNRDFINVDARWVGDGYFPKKLSREMLRSRAKDGVFYRPTGEAYFHSLLYHCRFHKRTLSSDYLFELQSIAPKDFDVSDFSNDSLYRYLTQRYRVTQPKDKLVQLRNIPRSRFQLWRTPQSL